MRRMAYDGDLIDALEKLSDQLGKLNDRLGRGRIKGVEERPHRCSLDSSHKRKDTTSRTTSAADYIPSFIYTRVSPSHDETDEGVQFHPDGMIDRTNAAFDSRKNDGSTKLGRRSIALEINRSSIKDDENDSFVPPHIIGENDMSDCDDDLEDECRLSIYPK